MAISETERLRYARQLALPEIGEAGQAKLAAARILLVGAGGLGSPAGLYLVAAGIGTLGVADGDRLDLSNLQRQIAHTTADVGQLKVESAARTFQALNPNVRLRLYPERLTAANAGAWLNDYDFVVDATDNFESKYLIAEVCHAAGKPYSHAGILRFFGQTITVLPGQTACYRCVFTDPPPPPATVAGPLGAVPGVIGTIQAAEAIKFVVGAGRLLTNRLLTFDALTMQFREIPVRRNPTCPVCGKGGHHG